MALPIIIHLINQRRYQTVRWAAMMFLLAANRMSRGYARLRQWLIMAMRMAAIAALDLRRQPAALRRLAGPGRRRPGRHHDHPARPLAQHAAGRRRRRAGPSSRPACGSWSQTLETLGSARWVLIDSTTNKPRELEIGRRPLDLARAPGRPARRPTCRRCCWPPATTSRPTRRAAPRSGSAPTCAKTTGTPPAAAGRCCATGSSS